MAAEMPGRVQAVDNAVVVDFPWDAATNGTPLRRLSRETSKPPAQTGHPDRTPVQESST